ncbi:hypothetical protein OKA04_12110 [Luteolibacter flavescens]|uniref:Uncharacterized protein n=1 Tax=Luteolibacter flavescens TaxID=1859460 RepID=A0ABT3FR81_9BACT|nr:hypothetical protein [Luteolibacter flavescens]MCW1885475.1 hypothetical protein [Luteolibacter flavescens]
MRFNFAFLFLLFSPLEASVRDSAIDELLLPMVLSYVQGGHNDKIKWDDNRNGGYLLRLEMDVTGDGRSEVFIASTLNSNRWGHSWDVFDFTENRMLRPYDESISFGIARSVTKNGQTSLDEYPFGDKERLRVSDEKPYEIIQYWFSFPRITEDKIYVSEEEAIKIRSANPRELPNLQAILLADYLVDPDAKWKDVVGYGIDMSDCWYLDEDKVRAENNTDFTPQVALLHLGLAPATPENQKKVSRPEKAAIPSRFKEPAARKAKEPPLTINGEILSSRRWPWVAVMVGAALGLLWVFLRKWR